MTDSVYLDIYIGDRTAYALSLASYESTCTLLSKNAQIYGFPDTPDLLSAEQQEILQDLRADKSVPLVFNPPPPLLVGRITVDLDSSPGLAKTRNNFVALCTGEKGSCKGAPNKKLHYFGCPMHRVVKGFIIQGGDVTRGDGSGGESIYGPKFSDEKVGLKTKPRRGTVAMANSGKNSNSSQFFIVLTDNETKLTKLSGKYVVFGQVRLGRNDEEGKGEGEEVLKRLDEIGGSDEKPSLPVWIGGCGVC